VSCDAEPTREHQWNNLEEKNSNDRSLMSVVRRDCEPYAENKCYEC